MTKSLRHLVALGAALFVLPLFSVAETAGPEPRLKAGDVQHFLESFPKMIADLKKLGDRYGDIEDPTAIQSIMASDEVQTIMQRYGWSQDTYLQKVTAIAGAYASVRMDEELANLPEEQRAMVKQMMGAQMPQLMQVHPSDVALVKKHRAKLDAFFDDN